jgi:hypothetical protein
MIAPNRAIRIEIWKMPIADEQERRSPHALSPQNQLRHANTGTGAVAGTPDADCLEAHVQQKWAFHLDNSVLARLCSRIL